MIVVRIVDRHIDGYVSDICIREKMEDKAANNILFWFDSTALIMTVGSTRR